METRPAHVDDAEQFGAVHVEVWRQTYTGLIDPEVLAGMDAGRYAAGWARRLAEPPMGMRTLVGLDGPDVVGFASAGPARDDDRVCDQELHALNLLARVQGSGLADTLVDEVLEPGACSLWVVVGNARAARFYARRGFVPDGATQRDERLGVVEERLVRPA